MESSDDFTHMKTIPGGQDEILVHKGQFDKAREYSQQNRVVE